MSRKIWVQPVATESFLRTTPADRHSRIVHVVQESGAELSELPEAEAIVWLDVFDPLGLLEVLKSAPKVKWVQLPWAGVETFHGAGLFEHPIVFTCAKGAYATQVAEHGLMLTLLSLRHVVAQARNHGWLGLEPDSLRGKKVTILGGGGIAQEYLRLIEPFGCEVRVVRKSNEPITGATVYGVGDLPKLLPDTEVLLLALSLTPETEGIIGKSELALLPPQAIVVNIARGKHIDQDALVEALKSQTIAAAALDVTDPEPLPGDHPLWDFDNVLITSHCADSLSYVTEQLANRVGENVRRFMQDEPLVGVVDPEAGY